ncbi:MAG: anthranilate synthase component I [Kiritimatiellae bacterium]|nr:anthranilate synthase component I [Kiritimatiellia bacterium]MDW8458525.1 anthranilate synthase component I [Verrucomicrobiota bacterium]
MRCFPDRTDFLQKATRGNLVPVWREVLADQETPVSAYEKLRRLVRSRGGSGQTFLLESVEGGEHIARYSFLGGAPHAIFEARGDRCVTRFADGRVESVFAPDPLTALRELMSRYRPVPDPALPRFFGGAVGYIGYDAISRFEPRVKLAPRVALDWPDVMMALTDLLVVFDHCRHTIQLVANAHIEGDAGAAYEAAVRRLDDLAAALAEPLPHQLLDVRERPPPLPASSNMTADEFRAAVLKAKDYIRAGDIIQVVLSQRFEVDYSGDPLDVYRAIRCINPSPYLYCLEFGDRAVVGSSPEIHVRNEGGRVEVRPIAGTRPRGADAAEDERLARELLADPKERAEHIMLVDLGRNDLGRVCRFGTVRVPELMVIEKYSHVMHIVSDVVGDLDPSRDSFDLMRATFPAGTVSGAPKIRAMEIIGELEPDRRGPYAGAIGYFGYSGNLDSCITIRTALLDGRRAHVQAGAGIVADSDPDREYEETCNKARGMLAALALSRRFESARARRNSG